MTNVTPLRTATRGYLAKVTSEFDYTVGGQLWLAEIHTDDERGTTKIGEVFASSRESALDRARLFVEDLQQPAPEPEWVRLTPFGVEE